MTGTCSRTEMILLQDTPSTLIAYAHAQLRKHAEPPPPLAGQCRAGDYISMQEDEVQTKRYTHDSKLYV